MALKTDYLIGVLNNVEAQLANRASANKAVATVQAVRERVQARKTLGEDPDTTQLSALYAQVKNAVDSFNSQTVSVPSEADVAAGVAAADSVTD